MKSRYLLRVICLLALLASFVPAGNASALVSTAVPPADMFQLPWEQGLAWVAIDGLDNGTKRPLSSSHHFSVGGAIDFAPHNNMVKGENTSTFWTTAAAAGTVVGTSACHVIIDHSNGWITQYQFLANVQVKLGDAVSRNQRLGIIADGVRQKFCPGSLEPNVPHLHFMLRPTMRNATFAGWQVNYLPVLNKTTFTKNGETLGLFKPLLNVMDSPSTPTATPSATTIPGSETPTASVTPSPTRGSSPTPTLFGPYVSTTVNPHTIYIDETTQATVRLNNVPAEGYTSAEFTCSFSANLVEVSNIIVTGLFGSDAVVALNGPQGNSFIVAIAGSNSNKATASGTVFTFDVKGLQVGETNLGCEARVSQGNNILTQIPSARTFLTVLSTEDTPTPNLTPGTPTVLPSACDKAEFIADVTVPPGTVMSPGTTFTKTWRLKNLGPCTWTTSYSLVFFHGDSMGAPLSSAFPKSVAAGETVDISINPTAPNAPGSYRGYWIFRNSSGINFGIGPQANQPWFVDINVAGPTLPPSPTSTPVPWSPTPTTTPDAPTATQTPTSGFPTPPPADCDKAEFVADVSLPPGTTVLPGQPLGKGWRVKNVGSCTWTPSYGIAFVGGPLMDATLFNTFSDNVFPGQEAEIFIPFIAPTIPGHYQSFWKLRNASGTLFGTGDSASDPFLLDILVSGPTVTPYFDLTPTPSPLPTSTLPADWLTFTNLVYGFEFKYPPLAVIADGRTDGFARIDLPFVLGTNLSEKYVEVIVQENVNLCQSPLQSQFSETITINGVSFLKQRGGDGAAGHIRQWIAYSTLRDNVCVSLDFILHSLNLSNFPTPPPSFDFGIESAVFEQIVSTYTWLALETTATPTFTSIPVESPTSTFTSTPVESPTLTFTPTPTEPIGPTPLPNGILTGKVIAGKPVTISLYDGINRLVASMPANPDGTFNFTVPIGTYDVTATASGFLSARGPIGIAGGNTTTLPTITLLAGDIDNSNRIDQFDAITIGINYNTAIPGEADLNNDGIINVLDLELLAKNYRRTGPVVWE